MPGSRPDLILSYNGKHALVLDYKGPNCIDESELKRFGASSVESARARLSKKKKSLLEEANQDERALIQQGVKYGGSTRAPCIVFYDYDYLLAMEPTLDLFARKPNIMLDVVLCREAVKSTRSQLVELEDNHVSVLLKYIVKAVSKVA